MLTEIDRLKEHKFILLGNEHYNPLGLIRTLGEQGIPVVAIILQGMYPYASKSKYITTLHMVDNLNEGLDVILTKYGNEEKKPFIFTCDDTATDFLNHQYDLLKDKYYFFNSGEKKLINNYMNKKEQVMLARNVGMRVLWTKEIEGKMIPDDVVYPVITKAVDSITAGWKALSFVCYNEQQLLNALNRIESDKILLQQFIDKKNELGIDGYSIDNGRNMLVTMAYNYKYVQDGAFSHYMNIFTPENKLLIELVKKYVEQLHYDGIFDIEFLEDKNGDLYFCEINLRNSGWSYASTKVGMPLPILWAIAKIDGEIDNKYQLQIRDSYTAIEGFDYLRGKKKRKQGWIDCIHDLFEADCHYIYNFKDIVPFGAYIISILKRKVMQIKV